MLLITRGYCYGAFGNYVKIRARSQRCGLSFNYAKYGTKMGTGDGGGKKFAFLRLGVEMEEESWKIEFETRAWSSSMHKISVEYRSFLTLKADFLDNPNSPLNQ